MSRAWELVRFEVAHQARQRSAWIYAAVLGGLAFLALTRFVANARGALFAAPLALAGATAVTTLLGLLVTAAVAADVATRDAQTRMAPLLHSAPVDRRTFLGARFLGAFGFNALLLAAVPAGLLLAVLSQGLEPPLAGPFRPAAYLGAYLFLALPNAFVATALLFSVATLGRGAVPAYVAALALFLEPLLVEGIVAEAMGRWGLARLLDPSGMVGVRELVRSWTPVQKDTLLLPLQGPLLWNRLLWSALALGALALTLARARFDAPARAGRRGRAARILPSLGDAGPPCSAPVAVPKAARSFGFAMRARQTLAVAWRSFRGVAAGRGAVALAVPAALLLLSGPVLLRESGVPLFPTTARIVGILTDPANLFLSVAAPFLAVVYAGEMVWRERETLMSDIVDAAPMPDWVPFAGRLLGLALVLGALQALTMAAGMLLQAGPGRPDFEIGVYLRVLFGLQLPRDLLFAVLALAVHAAVNHKYVGHLAVLLAYAFTVFAPQLGVEHPLLVYGSTPGGAYSDMRGFGPSAAPLAWFTLYWGAWALLLAVAAKLLWVRGRELGLAGRLRLARGRFTRPAAGAAAAAAALVLALGGFVFYNTNVLNEYRSAWAGAERRAEYERRYGRYAGVPQPRLAGTRLRVEIHPRRRAVEIRGSYLLVNETAAAIDSVHLATPPEVETGTVRLDRPATRVLADEALGHRIYALERPLQPGDSLRLGFTVRFEPHGFPTRGIGAAVAANGTHLANGDWLPAVGYQADRELSAPAERRARGLAPRAAARPLGDAAARRDLTGAERIAFDAVVGTDADQVAVAPGALRRTWTEGGRRYFHYATDVPIRNDFAVFSAAYAVRSARWKDVSIQVFHHPAHAWNVDRMIRAVRASLEDYGEQFGPYPHRQIRLVEYPGRGNSLHSAPVDIAYKEDFSLFHPEADPREIDFPFAVVAHEVAHQWWGNQVTPAFVEGGAVLTESLAWYSAMGVVERTHGPAHLRRVLAAMRQEALSPRARAGVPLLRATDRFDTYRKGPFAMYALREYVGEARVNAALRRFLQAHGSGAPPLPTSLDLYRELQAATPDSLRSLLADLFEANSYWELSAKQAPAEPAGGGAWRVTLDVRARKVVVDSAGAEREVPMNDPVEIGVFAAGRDGGPGTPLYLRMHRVRSGGQRITVTVPGRPARAGIDPRNLLIDVKPDDNTAEVSIAARPGPGRVNRAP